MSDKGWIKLHRRLLDCPNVMRDADYFAVWVYLLLSASHAEYATIFGGKKIILQAGQLITGRKVIEALLGIDESKVYRILMAYKNDEQIEIKSNNRASLITIVNWEKYQLAGNADEQPMNNKRTTSEQQVNTIQEDKELKNKKDIYCSAVKEVVDYLNVKCNRNFSTAEGNAKYIRARLKEGHTVEECKKVIDNKYAKWGNDARMFDYLRPSTLFASNKFEGYLQEEAKGKAIKSKNQFNNFQQNQYDYEALEREILAN